MHFLYEPPEKFFELAVSELIKQLKTIILSIVKNTPKGAAYGITVSSTIKEFKINEILPDLGYNILYGGLATMFACTVIGVMQYSWNYFNFKYYTQPLAKKNLIKADKIFQNQKELFITNPNQTDITEYINQKNEFIKKYKSHVKRILKKMCESNKPNWPEFYLLNENFLLKKSKNNHLIINKVKRKAEIDINIFISIVKSYLMSINNNGKHYSSSELKQYLDPKILQILNENKKAILLPDTIYKRPFNLFIIKLEELMEESIEKTALFMQDLEQNIEKTLSNQTNLDPTTIQTLTNNIIQNFISAIQEDNQYILVNIELLIKKLLQEMKELQFYEPRYRISQPMLSNSEINETSLVLN